MSKKARPFDRRRAKAKRRRTEAAQELARVRNRDRALSSYAAGRAERASRHARMAEGQVGRSAHFAAAQAGSYEWLGRFPWGGPLP